MSRPEVCVVTGLRPSPVALFEGDVYRVGRPERRWLRDHGKDGYLALDDKTPRTVPTVALLLIAGRRFVDVRFETRVTPVDIDGTPLGREPIRLTGTHEITVDSHGRAQRFRVACSAERIVSPAPTPPSGTTVVPRLHLTGERLRGIAVALAWPLVGDVPPPLTPGWSTGAVSGRYEELFGTPPPYPPQRTLHDLRVHLEQARDADGRPLATVPELHPWPWPRDWRAAGFLTKKDFYEEANRCTAGHLANNDWVREMLHERLDRPR